MPIFPEAPIRLHVSGIVGDDGLSGVASVAVNADGVLLVPLDPGPHEPDIVRIPFEGIEGALAADEAGGTLHLFLAGGRVVIGHGNARVRGLAEDILHRGRMIPELTRTVRALGRSRGGEEQDAFFRPLLDAKRRAVRSWDAALHAFDAEALRAALDETLSRMAAAREPERAAARRALEARLCDAAEPLRLAFAPVGRAAAAARAAEPRIALREWRAWVRAVHVMFDRADAAWPDVHAALAASRIAFRPAPTPVPLDRLRLPWIR